MVRRTRAPARDLRTGVTEHPPRPRVNPRAVSADRGYAQPVIPLEPRFRRRLRAPGVFLVAFALVVAACRAGAAFDPAGPCDVDGKVAGAYPALEAMAPTTFDGQPPTTLDSGRSCSTDALGTLLTHDVHELRFGGATWDFGGGHALTIAVLALPNAPLPAAWVEEFYEQGARNARNTEHIDVSRPTFELAGAVFRLDTLNSLSFQTVVVWPDGDHVRAVIVASPVSASASRADHDALVERAIGSAAAAASAATAAPSPGAS